MQGPITIAVAAATAMSLFVLLFWLMGTNVTVVASTGLQHVGFALPGL